MLKFQFIILYFTVVSAFTSIVSFALEATSSDASANNWRQIQHMSKKRQKNKQKQRLKLQKLRNLNEEMRVVVNESTHLALLYNRFLHDDAVPVAKYAAAKCTYVAADCSMEIQEQEAVAQLITERDIVLELGGRFGTTSCSIAHYQKNSGKLVVVEPDPDVWYILARNQQIHRCSFWTFRGVVSHHPTQLTSAEYATRATPVLLNPAHKKSDKNPISFMDYMTLQHRVGLYFTALLIDCEGCIEQVFALPKLVADSTTDNTSNHFKTLDQYRLSTQQENYVEQLLQNVTTIIIETDMKENTPHCQHHCVDYKKWFVFFRKIGFIQVFQQKDILFSFIDHVAFHREILK